MKKGRVDVVGATGLREQLLLVNEKAKSARDITHAPLNSLGVMPSRSQPKAPVCWAWKIVTHDLGGARFVEIDQESFFDVLMDVANAKVTRRA